jgi:hypothetical protein
VTNEDAVEHAVNQAIKDLGGRLDVFVANSKDALDTRSMILIASQVEFHGLKASFSTVKYHITAKSSRRILMGCSSVLDLQASTSNVKSSKVRTSTARSSKITHMDPSLPLLLCPDISSTFLNFKLYTTRQRLLSFIYRRVWPSNGSSLPESTRSAQHISTLRSQISFQRRPRLSGRGRHLW